MFCLTCKHGRARDPQGNKGPKPIWLWCEIHKEFKDPQDTCDEYAD